MIVVTGLGRSGTSFVAALYRELGFDPGGAWNPQVSAGLEDHEVVRLNERIIRDLRIGTPERELPRGARRVEQWLPWAWRRRQRLQPIPETFAIRAEVRWDRLRPAVARHGPTLREAAAERRVVKDPRFCWTLGVWAGAGAALDHVVICVRHLDAILQSRHAAGMLAPSDRSRNAFLYGLGLCVQSLVDHDVPYEIVRFPQFAEDPDELWHVMRFPGDVERKDFDRAFAAINDRAKIHDWR